MDDKFFKTFDNKIVNNKSIMGQPKVGGYFISGNIVKEITINSESDCCMQILKVHPNYLQYISSKNMN